MRVITMMAIAILFGTAGQTYAQQDNSILSDDYITSQEFIDAKVIRVRPRSRTLTVRGVNQGQTRDFVMPEGVRISVNGKQASLRDVRRGDNVRLAIKKVSKRVVIDRMEVPQTAVSLEQRRAEPVTYEEVPAMLPKTAGNQPLLVLLGILALIGAVTLRFGAKRRKV